MNQISNYNDQCLNLIKQLRRQLNQDFSWAMTQYFKYVQDPYWNNGPHPQGKELIQQFCDKLKEGVTELEQRGILVQKQLYEKAIQPFISGEFLKWYLYQQYGRMNSSLDTCEKVLKIIHF